MCQYKYKGSKDYIWVDSGHIKVHNYPPDNMTYSYITRTYRTSPDFKERDGEPIYFKDMKPEEVSLAIILCLAEKSLGRLCPREEFLIKIKS